MAVVSTNYVPLNSDQYEQTPEEQQAAYNAATANLQNTLLTDGIDLSGLSSMSANDLFSPNHWQDMWDSDPDHYMNSEYFRSGSGMDNAYNSGYMGHYYIGEDGNRYRKIVTYDRERDAMKEEYTDERMYRWSPSDEHKRTHRDDGTAEAAYGKEYKGSGGTGWYTEAEIKAAWDAGDMHQMQEQGVSWDQYWGYVTGVDELINAGIIDYKTSKEDSAAILQGEKEADNWMDIPEYRALVEGLGIPLQFDSRGDVYNFNGFGYSRDYWSDKSDAPAVIKTAMALAISWAAGPALVGAFQGAGMSAAMAKAASSAIIKTATGYMQTGNLDLEDALLSAAMAYGGASLSDALQGSGVLGEIGSKVTEFGDSLVEGGGNILSAALQAGGMSLVTQMVKEGEIDWKDAAMAAVMAGGTVALTDFLSGIGKDQAVAEKELSEWDEFDEWQQEAMNADIKDPFLNPNYKTVGDGLVMNINTNEVFGVTDNKSYGNFADLDQNGDGQLSGSDLSEINAPDRDLKNIYNYELGDTVYVDANGNPVDPKLVRMGPDGPIGYDANGNRVPLTEKTYDQVFGGGKGDLKWQFGINDDGSISTTDGAIYYENGDLAYEKVTTTETLYDADGNPYESEVTQWRDANGNIIDDPTQVDELTMIAAKAIDEPLESVTYFDQNGNPMTFKYPPHALQDNYAQGQFSGLIFGPNGEVQEVWYDPVTNTEYIKAQGTTEIIAIRNPDEPPKTPENPSNTDSSNSPTGEDNNSTDTGANNNDTASGTASGGTTDATGGEGEGGPSGGASLPGGNNNSTGNPGGGGASGGGATGVPDFSNMTPAEIAAWWASSGGFGNPGGGSTGSGAGDNTSGNTTGSGGDGTTTGDNSGAGGDSGAGGGGNSTNTEGGGGEDNTDGGGTGGGTNSGGGEGTGTGGNTPDNTGGGDTGTNTGSGTGTGGGAGSDGGTDGTEGGGSGGTSGGGTDGTSGGTGGGAGGGGEGGGGSGGNGLGSGNGMLSGTGGRDRPEWGPLLQGYQFKAKPKPQPTVGMRMFEELWKANKL